MGILRMGEHSRGYASNFGTTTAGWGGAVSGSDDMANIVPTPPSEEPYNTPVQRWARQHPVVAGVLAGAAMGLLAHLYFGNVVLSLLLGAAFLVGIWWLARPGVGDRLRLDARRRKEQRQAKRLGKDSR